MLKFFEERRRQKVRDAGAAYLGRMADELGIERSFFIGVLEDAGMVRAEFSLKDGEETPAETIRIWHTSIHRAFDSYRKAHGDSEPVKMAKHRLGPASYLEDGTAEVLERYGLKVKQGYVPDERVEAEIQRSLQANQFPGGYHSAMLLIDIAVDDYGRGCLYPLHLLATISGLPEKEVLMRWLPLAGAGWVSGIEDGPDALFRLFDQGTNSACDIVLTRLYRSRELGLI